MPKIHKKEWTRPKLITLIRENKGLESVLVICKGGGVVGDNTPATYWYSCASSWNSPKVCAYQCRTVKYS